jgi:hypothetical protein
MSTTDTRTAIFDDTYPGISYRWGPGITYAPTFLSSAMNGTVHGISGEGGGFSIRFTGEKISLIFILRDSFLS